MKQLIILVSCARCGAQWQEGDPPEGSVMDATLKWADQEGLLDLCAACTKELAAAVAGWMALAIPVAKPKRPYTRRQNDAPVVATTVTSADLRCEDHEGPSGCKRAFPTMQGVRMHQFRAHGMKVSKS